MSTFFVQSKQGPDESNFNKRHENEKTYCPELIFPGNMFLCVFKNMVIWVFITENSIICMLILLDGNYLIGNHYLFRKQLLSVVNQ